MAAHLYLATENGLVIAERTASTWRALRRVLVGQEVTRAAAIGPLIVAGTTQGAYRSLDGGLTWQPANRNLTVPRIRWLTFPPRGHAFLLAGTEPAGIFVSRDDGESWAACPEVGELAQAHSWYLPYSPAAGCVRGFAVHGYGAFNARVYAAVEVGGVLHSADSGETWQLVEGSDGNPNTYFPYSAMIHPDVHSIVVHPSIPDLIFAPTGGGLFRSADGGATWEQIHRGYCRAVWVDPRDPRHAILGPADGVAQNGRIEVTHDGGQTWQPAMEGMAAPWEQYMVEHFTQGDRTLLATLSNGELWSTWLAKLKWQRSLPEIQGIHSATITMR